VPSSLGLTFDGATIEDYITRGLAHLWVLTQQLTDLAKPDGFKVFVRGEGVWLWDMKGRRFLDAMSGLCVVNAGHGRTELADVAAEQMRSLGYINTFAYASMPAVDLASKLAELLPPSLNKVYFVNSGSEAVETAVRMAKHYQYNIGEKKRYKVIARRGSYHGMTAGALSINSSTYANRAPYEPLLPGVIAVEGVNCYRCPFEKTYPESEVACAVALANIAIIEREGLVENAALVGGYLQDRLRGLMETHPILGDVRGRGLLLALEIVKDRATKEQFAEGDDLTEKLTAAQLQRGLLCRAGNVVNIAPPLVITHAEADTLVGIVDEALGEVERGFGLV
jgi:adenosylmethionine-8-amino-7-oxononanoate aminotransferase